MITLLNCIQIVLIHEILKEKLLKNKVNIKKHWIGNFLIIYYILVLITPLY